MTLKTPKMSQKWVNFGNKILILIGKWDKKIFESILHGNVEVIYRTFNNFYEDVQKLYQQIALLITR